MKRRPWIRIALAALGAGIAAAGVYMAWYEVKGGVTVGSRSITGTPTGRETSLGNFALVAAAVTLLLALIAAIGRARRWIALLIVIAALGTASTTLRAWSDPQRGYTEFVADETTSDPISRDEISRSLGALFQRGSLNAETGRGVYATTGGAGIAALAGLSLLFIGRRTGRDPTELEPIIEERPSPSTIEPG